MTASHNKSTPVQKLSGHRWFWASAVVLLLGAAGSFWVRADSAPSASRDANGSHAPLIPVIAAKAERGDMGVELTALGTVTPLRTVTVTSRVDGELMNVLYREGQLVRKGDLLAQIDSRPFKAQLLEAEGQLARDQSLLANARIDLKRYEELLPRKAVTQQTVATQKSLVAQYGGAVKSDQGQVAAAKLNLIYSRITAPVNGRIGLRLVDPGNIVSASTQSALLVITQVQPISVIFTIAEDQVPAVVRKMAARQALKVTAVDRAGQTKLAEGVLASLDNQIDPATGTLKMRANFENRDDALFPNQFVNVRLLIDEKRDITKVPDAVVQRNSSGTYVYAVNPDSTVTVRNITIGATEDGETEITSGLAPGDVVVMTGSDKLEEGSQVSVSFSSPEARAQVQ